MRLPMWRVDKKEGDRVTHTTVSPCGMHLSMYNGINPSLSCQLKTTTKSVKFEISRLFSFSFSF